MPAAAAVSRAGRRCNVCGPKIRSTYGARAQMRSPSWLATQPPTAISTLGSRCLSGRQRPSSENSLSAAFSRTEQVFMSRTLACSGSDTRAKPWLRESTAAILSESYSFI
jgi:hypothetical protein